MKIVFHSKFRKKLYKLDLATQEKFFERLRLFVSDMTDRTLRNHALTGEYAGYRSINIRGDLLALYSRTSNGLVEFRYLGTHHELYGS